MIKYIHAIFLSNVHNTTEIRPTSINQFYYTKMISIMLIVCKQAHIVCIHYLMSDKKVGNLIILGADLPSSYHVHIRNGIFFLFFRSYIINL